MHAACAKVAHLSGAGEYTDELELDREIELMALSRNLSSYLDYFLHLTTALGTLRYLMFHVLFPFLFDLTEVHMGLVWLRNVYGDNTAP